MIVSDIGPTPTTHILKLPMGKVGGVQADFSTSVDNEWLCLRILKAFDLPAANAEVARFGSQRVLVVERFDRARSASVSRILRLPQEDFCQATGLPSRLKYEADGGPGLQTLFNVLTGSTTPEDDARTLMKAQVLFWLLRAPDGHAKNFLLRILTRGAYELTPLYDVMSAWPIIGRGKRLLAPQKVRLAMALLGASKHYQMHDIQVRHFETTARVIGYPGEVRALLEEVTGQADQALASAITDLPFDFSEHVFKAVTEGMRAAIVTLKKQLAAGKS